MYVRAISFSLALPARTRLPLFAVLGCLALACAGPAPAGARAARARGAAAAGGCPPGKGSRKAGGGLYMIENRTSDAGAEEFFLCSSAGGHPFHIGTGGGSEGFESANVVFAGLQAALVCGEGNELTEIKVVDLASDRVSYRHELPENEKHGESVKVGRLVLKRDGSIAWTELIANGTYEVIEHSKHGSKTLDATNTTRPYSLKLKGSELEWVEHDGAVRTATLD